MSDRDQSTAASDDHGEAAPRREAPPPEASSCDICGGTDLVWLRCKLVCNRCHTVLLTCGDL